MNSKEKTNDELMHELHELKIENEKLRIRMKELNSFLQNSENSKQFFETEVLQKEREIINSKETINKSNLTLQLSLAISNSGIWEWDIEKNNFYWSEEFLNIFQMDQDVIPGFESWLNKIHPCDREITKKRVYQSIDEKTGLTNEYRIILENNEIHWIRSTGKTLYKNEKPVRMIGLCMDITEHKLIEIAHFQSEDRFRLIFETLSEGVALNEMIFNEDGEMIDYKILEVNSSFYKIADYHKHEKVIGNFASKLYGMDSEFIKEFWKNHKYAQETVCIEMISPINNKYYSISTSPFKNNKFVTSFQDITERKLSEEDLLLNDIYLKKAQEIGKIGHFSYDLSTNVIEGSPELYRILDFDRNTPFLKAFSEAVHPEDTNLIFPLIDRVIQYEIPYDVEHRVLRKNGSIIYVHSKCGIIETSKGVRMVGTIQDISERKEGDQALFETTKFNESLLQTIPYGMDIVDKEGTILFMSENFKRKFGENVVGKKCWYVYRDDKKQCIDCPLYSGINIGETKIYEATGVLGGKIFEISHTGMMFNGQEAMLEIFIDVTERKSASEALFEREKLIRDIAASIPGVVYQFVQYPDGKFEIPYMSESAVKLFSRPLSDLKDPSKIFNDLHPDDYVNLFASILESAKTLVPWHFEARIIPKNGTLIWIKGMSNPSRLSDGKICWNGVLLDITDLKLVEEELIKQKLFFEQLFMQSSVSTQILDKDGWCERINPKLSEIFGVAPKDIEGNVYNIFKDEGIIKGGVLPYLEGVFKEGKTMKWEVLFDIGIAADSQNINVTKKKKIWFENWSYPIFDISGNLSHVIIQHNDINSRKEAEEALNHEKEFSDNLIESLPGIFYMFDSNFVPLRWNLNKADLLGLTNEQMKTHNTIDFIADKDKEKVVNSFKDVFLYGESHEEANIVRYDGRELTFHLTGKRYETANGPLLLGVGIDISKRVKAENELIIALARAEESDRLKTAFLQNMSHEIRTPLNGILGFTQLLVLDDITKEEIKEFTGLIQQSGNRLNEIINNILDISKIETGQIVINKKKFSIISLLKGLHKFYTPIANSKSLSLNFKIPSDQTNYFIDTDETRLNQILSNLLNNAVKFTFNGYIEFGIEILNKEVCFFVKDTGIGISPDLHKKIFERFIQAEDSVHRQYEGAGLGLAISNELVKLLGGKIWVESEINKGSIFYFTLPYFEHQNLQRKEDIKTNTDELTKKSTVLVVEDDEASSLFLLKFFKNSKYAVLLAEDGQQAIDLVKSNPEISLILMDIRIPIINGIEATRQIKLLRPELPIIAQSAYSYSEEMEQILAVGCDEYISKPIDIAKLLIIIKRYLK